MLDSLGVVYHGPTDFITTDLEPQAVRMSLSCPNGLPVAAEVRLSITGFRAFTDGGWELDRVEVTGGEGRIVVGHGLPLHFRELVWPGISPGGGQLVGGDHRRIQMCTLIVTKALGPSTGIDFSMKVVGPRHARIYPTLELSARLQGDTSFTQIGEPVILNTRPGEPERLELRTKPYLVDGNVQGVLFATDKFGNPVPAYRSNVNLPASAAMIEKAPGNYALTVPSVASHMPIRIELNDTGINLNATSPVIIPGPGANHYFGAIHFHTDYSVDGDGKLEDAYSYARDWLNLDVVAVTDHAPLGYQWEQTLRINEDFYDPRKFVTIPAWESSTAYGHANIYLKSSKTDADPGNWDPARNPSEMTWPEDALVIPHHTNAGEDPFSREQYAQALSDGLYWTIYDWTVPNHRVRLVEIVQGRGDFEADTVDPTWDIKQGNRGASIQDAFRLGWRLGFVAGTDNHQAYPTHLNGQYTGMTCFLASELTRESVWESMNQRRTYATTGVQIVCDFMVNGLPVGSEGTRTGTDGVWFSAHLHGTAPIERVEIISNGSVIWESRPDALDVELNQEELPSPGDASAYYYLRLRQSDGHRAWLSPVWLDFQED